MQNTTNIYVSRKLETVVPPTLLQSNDVLTENPIGKWTATLFYISKKKCILITNSITRYSVILPGFVKSDFNDLSNRFTSSFINQLESDRIQISQPVIEPLIGQVALFRTDNDKKIIGTQNYILSFFEFWKLDFGDYSNWDFYEIGRRINDVPYSQLGWKTPRDKMTDLIAKISKDEL